MKLWVPVAFVAVIAVAYGVFYLMSVDQSLAGSPLGLANILGLATVFVGLIAAGLIIKRAKPHE